MKDRKVRDKMYKAKEERYDEMQYLRCGKSGLLLPRVALGLWHNFGSIDHFENQKALLFEAFDQGITHFDLANNYGPVYGSAEENNIIQLACTNHFYKCSYFMRRCIW